MLEEQTGRNWFAEKKSEWKCLGQEENSHRKCLGHIAQSETNGYHISKIILNYFTLKKNGTILFV